MDCTLILQYKQLKFNIHISRSVIHWLWDFWIRKTPKGKIFFQVRTIKNSISYHDCFIKKRPSSMYTPQCKCMGSIASVESGELEETDFFSVSIPWNIKEFDSERQRLSKEKKCLNLATFVFEVWISSNICSLSQINL